jgi:hypothetical protein
LTDRAGQLIFYFKNPEAAAWKASLQVHLIRSDIFFTSTSVLKLRKKTHSRKLISGMCLVLTIDRQLEKKIFSEWHSFDHSDNLDMGNARLAELVIAFIIYSPKRKRK